MARGIKNIRQVSKITQPKGTFAALKSKLAKRPGVTNPGALAAAIGRKKFGKSRFQKMAASGRKTK